MEASERQFNIRIMLCIIVVILVTTMIVLFMKKHFDDAAIIKNIDKKESMLIYVTDDNCSDCLRVEDILDDNKVNYNIMNKDKNKDYKKVIKKLQIEESDLPTPALIYVSEGVKYATLVGISDMDELNYFIKYYELDNTKKGS